jgi:hypothetical protein
MPIFLSIRLTHVSRAGYETRIQPVGRSLKYCY